MSTRFCIVLVALVACDSGGGGGTGTSAGPKTAESEGTKRGSAGGFSATMSAELAKQGGGGQSGASAPAPAPPRVGSGAAPTAGSAAVAPAPAPAPVAGSAAPTPTAGAAAPAPATASAAGVSKGSAAPPVETTQAPARVGKSTGAVGAIAAPASRAYAKPPADLAAIKLELEPNWERDMGEAGTFSLVVKIPNTNDTRLFSVRYGYEDQSAPVDCDQYKKFLEDKKLMKVSLNRQRGAACYIEGTDQGGVEAYRFLLTYGGKRLMCHGSRYKDAGAAALGDLRDKVLLQAKKICETLAL